MDTVLAVVNWLLPLVYLALVIDYGATFILRIRTHVRNPGVILVIALHAGFLVLWGARFARPPLGTSYEVLSVIALSSAIVYWVIELACRDRRAGVFVFLLIFLLQYTSSGAMAGAVLGASAAGRDVQPSWSRLHVIPASLAYTALAFAAVYALLYWAGQRGLKRHRFGLLFDRLPPLELLGRMCWSALLGGFVLMTVTILTGAIVFGQGSYAARHPTMDPKVMAKIVVGSVAWIICAVAIFGKLALKWPISRVSRIALVGFAAIAVLLIASIALS